MSSSESRSVTLSAEEYTRIGEIARPLWERGVSDNPPQLVVLMGGVGSGKTTIRRQKYDTGYVHFDFWEIYMTVKKAVGEDEPRLTSYASMTSDLILRECIEGKKNIVIEIIGDDQGMIEPVLDGMKKIGYAVSLEYVACDPVEAYARHLKAVTDDKDYFSAHFTQEATLSFFYRLLGLGEMPVKVKDASV